MQFFNRVSPRKALIYTFVVVATSTPAVARAEIKVGVTASATGILKTSGLATKNATTLCPATIDGQKVNYVILDDAGNPDRMTMNARKLVAENKVDLLIAPGLPSITEVAAESRTPQLALAPYTDALKHTWVFRMPQSTALMAAALVVHMKKSNVKALGFIGYSDVFSQQYLDDTRKALEGSGIQLTAVERIDARHTSATGQAVKVLAANPDAVLVVGIFKQGLLPQITLLDLGYKGKFYQSHSAVNDEFLKEGDKAVEGTVFPASPFLLVDQLPDSHPSKKAALEFRKKYESAYGVTRKFEVNRAAQVYDACLILQAAAPPALRKTVPGTADFRQALRDAIESGREIVGTGGVYNFTPEDHSGQDERARVLIKAENGGWKLIGD